jgi:hypothetical protein
MPFAVYFRSVPCKMTVMRFCHYSGAHIFAQASGICERAAVGSALKHAVGEACGRHNAQCLRQVTQGWQNLRLMS